MKKLSYLFAFVFLIGMFFSVFKFSPQLKLKGQPFKSELIKKILCENQSDDTCNSEDDHEDSDTESDIFFSHILQSDIQKYSVNHYSQHIPFQFEFHINSIPSPPPKFQN